MPTWSKDGRQRHTIIGWDAGRTRSRLTREESAGQGATPRTAGHSGHSAPGLSCTHSPQPGTISTLAACGRHRVIQQHKEKLIKKSNTQESVSEQSEYLKSWFTQRRILSLIPHTWKVKISLGPLWVVDEEATQTEKRTCKQGNRGESPTTFTINHWAGLVPQKK